MSNEKLSRRTFLQAAAMASAGAALIACQPQTVVVEKVVKETVEVEKEKVVKETVVVEKEKQVEVTKIVEKEVKVTVMPSEVREPPDLFALSAQGKIPKVSERIPSEPLVIPTVEEIGVYGGTWRRVAVAPNDVGIIDSRLSYVSPLRYTAMATEIVPHVAKGFEPNADSSEFTFHLRKGLRWSNGQPYTADDIMFWYEDMMLNADYNPSGIGGWLKMYDTPVVVEKVDDYTVKYKFAGSYGLFIPQMASTAGYGIFAWNCKSYLTQFHPKYAKAEELEQKIKDAKFEKWQDLFNNRRGWMNIERPMVFPWTMTKVPPDIPAVAERNPYFWAIDPEGNQLPYIDRIRFEVVENIDILNTKVLAGAVDMQFRHISWANYPLYVENAQVGDYKVFKWTLAEGSNYCLHFNINHENPGLRELQENKLFRHALSVAIDRDEINEVAYSGLGTPRQSSVLPGIIGYKPEQSEAYAHYDPDQASKWLDEIGLTKKDAEGFRLNLRGEPLTFNIEYSPIFGPWGDITQMLCNYWKKIGIRAFPKEEARPLFAERANVGTVQDLSVWQQDRAAHWLIEPLYQMPRRGSTPSSVGALYWDWWTSGGKQGEEPPAEVKQAYELYDKCKMAKNDEEMAKYATELLDLNAEQTWFIGIVGLLPHVGIVKNNFHNVPKEAVSDWLCLTPGNTYSEQYFFKETK